MNYKIAADDTELSLKGKSTKDDDKYKDNYTIGANERYKNLRLSYQTMRLKMVTNVQTKVK